MWVWHINSSTTICNLKKIYWQRSVYNYPINLLFCLLETLKNSSTDQVWWSRKKSLWHPCLSFPRKRESIISDTYKFLDSKLSREWQLFAKPSSPNSRIKYFLVIYFLTHVGFNVIYLCEYSWIYLDTFWLSYILSVVEQAGFEEQTGTTCESQTNESNLDCVNYSHV